MKEEDEEIDIEQPSQQALHPIQQPSTTTDTTTVQSKQYPKRYRRPIHEWKNY